VVRGKFCQLPWASSQNNVVHRCKIVQSPRLATASHLWLKTVQNLEVMLET